MTTEFEDIKRDISEIKGDMRLLMTAFHDLKTSRAVAEERQIETSKKIDLLTLTVSNNYTSAVEFGTFKVAANEKIEKLENWLTWILRLAVGTFIAGIVAAARIKGGL